MRTGFEFARMLWMLDPWTDPHGALMHLDFLAVKAEQYDWFIETEEAWEDARNEKTFLRPLDRYPGWLWSKALILKGMGVKRGGGEVCLCPDIGGELTRALEKGNRSSQASDSRISRSASYACIYHQCSHSLWYSNADGDNTMEVRMLPSY